MPTPGPRTQFGPVPGYDNPGFESPDRINPWKRPGSVSWPGRSPGMMIVTLRGCRLAAGQVRRLWRQSIDYIPAQAAYSWTQNAPGPDRPITAPGGFQITRALRYMTHSLYMGAGIDNTRYVGLHTLVPPKVRSKAVTLSRGQKRNAPTTRNRVSSFGSRVPPLNPTIDGVDNG